MKTSNGPYNETRFNRDIIKTYKSQTFRMHSKLREYFYSPEQANMSTHGLFAVFFPRFQLRRRVTEHNQNLGERLKYKTLDQKQTLKMIVAVRIILYI